MLDDDQEPSVDTYEALGKLHDWIAECKSVTFEVDTLVRRLLEAGLELGSAFKWESTAGRSYGNVPATVSLATDGLSWFVKCVCLEGRTPEMRDNTCDAIDAAMPALIAELGARQRDLARLKTIIAAAGALK